MNIHIIINIYLLDPIKTDESDFVYHGLPEKLGNRLLVLGGLCQVLFLSFSRKLGPDFFRRFGAGAAESISQCLYQALANAVIGITSTYLRPR